MLTETKLVKEAIRAGWMPHLLPLVDKDWDTGLTVQEFEQMLDARRFASLDPNFKKLTTKL